MYLCHAQPFYLTNDDDISKKIYSMKIKRLKYFTACIPEQKGSIILDRLYLVFNNFMLYNMPCGVVQCLVVLHYNLINDTFSRISMRG